MTGDYKAEPNTYFMILSMKNAYIITLISKPVLNH